MPVYPNMATVAVAPVSGYINMVVAGMGIIPVNINIPVTLPGPFAWYPISVGIRGCRAHVVGFCWSFGYIVTAGT
jgi:hypothetical protein